MPTPLGAQGWRSYAPIILVGLLGILVTWLIFARVSDLERHRRHSAFSEAARDRLLVIQREVTYALGVVQDVGSFFDASRHVTRRQFREFVGPALKRNEGIKSLQWVPRVVAEERDRFIFEARRSFHPYAITERRPDGALKSASARPIHFPVLYVQPYSEHKALLGLDLASDADEHSALRNAAQAHALRVSVPEPIASATGEQSGFTAYLPVYERAAEEEGGDSGETEVLPAQELSPRLRGFAIGLFLVRDLVEQALGTLGPSGVDMGFFSSEPESLGQPFYFHLSRVRTNQPANQADGQDVDRPEYRDEIVVGNRTWTVVCNPVPGYFERDSWSGYLIVGGGIAFTLLSSVFLLTSLGRAEQVRRLVAQRTVELEGSNTALNKEIAERRRAEHALQILNVTLEQRVARRTGEAERRARDLEQF
ncbi:MAG: CHASE domain-containing protein, partial [Pseudomonadota bacterium]|nr:CHASE domain-containing protein [Pseudomonadota bacterium]